MKSIAKGIGIFILIIVIACSGIFYFKGDELKKHFTPVIEQTGIMDVNMENDTAYISARLLATNNTFLEIKVDTIKYKVEVFDKVYIKDIKFLGMVLSGHSTDTIDFSLKVPFKMILKDIKAERKKGDSAAYAIDVSVQYSTFLGEREMEVNKAARLKIPQPPDVEITDIVYTKVSFKHIRANVKIRIINYNPFNLSVKQVDYSLDIAKQGNLKGKHTSEINIKPNATTTFDLPIEINPKNIGKTFFDVIRNKDLYNYLLTLNATLESPDLGKTSFPLHLTKKGRMELRK